MVNNEWSTQDNQNEDQGVHQEIQPRDRMTKIEEPGECQKNAEARQRLITLIDMQGREVHYQDRIIERIAEFYTELYDSEQSVVIMHTDPKEVREIALLEGGCSTKRYVK